MPELLYGRIALNGRWGKRPAFESAEAFPAGGTHSPRDKAAAWLAEPPPEGAPAGSNAITPLCVCASEAKHAVNASSTVRMEFRLRHRR